MLRGLFNNRWEAPSERKESRKSEWGGERLSERGSSPRTGWLRGVFNYYWSWPRKGSRNTKTWQASFAASLSFPLCPLCSRQFCPSLLVLALTRSAIVPFPHPLINTLLVPHLPISPSSRFTTSLTTHSLKSTRSFTPSPHDSLLLPSSRPSSTKYQPPKQLSTLCCPRIRPTLKQIRRITTLLTSQDDFTPIFGDGTSQSCPTPSTA